MNPLPPILMCCALSITTVAAPPAALEQQIRDYLSDLPARVGVAWISRDGYTGQVNGGELYPLMSVFKLHQAVYVSHQLQQQGLSLDTPLTISRNELRPGTWSPLRDRYPNGGVELPIRTLLEYTLKQSDNNACDILFKHFGGPGKVESYIHSLGIRDVVLSCTEAEMQGSIERSQLNRSTPSACVSLLYHLLTRHLLEPKLQAFLLHTMTGCTTGTDRLARPFQGEDARIGHKTGTGPEKPDGQQTGINDVGFVLLPNGRFYCVAVMIAESRLSAAETASIIARISEMIYQYHRGGR